VKENIIYNDLNIYPLCTLWSLRVFARYALFYRRMHSTLF